jgi:formyl-CoA transferase
MPDDQMGTIPMHAVVPRLSESPGAIRHPAPKLGEHTEEVLSRLSPRRRPGPNQEENK